MASFQTKTGLANLYGVDKDPEIRVIAEEKHKLYSQNSAAFNLLFNKATMSGTDIYQISTFSGVKGPEQVGIGEAPAYDTFKKGFTTTITSLIYRTGYAVPKEVEEDQVKLNLTKRAMDFFMKGHAEKREYILAGILNDAFTTALADGKVLCATDHPLEGVPGGTNSNLGTSAALSKTALRALRNVSQNQLDEQGNRVAATNQFLVVGQYHQDTVIELLVSEYDPENANNNINTLKDSFSLLPGTYWPHLGSSNTSFFVMNGASENYLYHIQHDPYTVGMEYIPDTRVTKYFTNERYGVGVGSFRGISGNVGV